LVEPVKSVQSSGHGRQRRAEGGRCKSRGEGVGEVVDPAQPQLGLPHDRLAVEHQLVAIEVCIGRPGDRESAFTRRGAGRGNHRVVRVEHRHIGVTLEGEEAFFGSKVGVEVGVALEVVLAQVEENRRLRRQLRQKLGLEARDLEHPTFPASVEHELRGRGAEVAAGHCGLACLEQHARGQLGHCALAVGSGDRHQIGLRPVAPRELDLGVDLDSLVASRCEKRGIGRNAGRGHDQANAFEALPRMAAEKGPDTVAKLLQFSRQLGLPPEVGDPDLGTVGRGETHRGEAGASQPDHQHPGRDLERHSYLSFRVDSPARAKTTAMIQNRTTTWVSVQPRSSK
jgi:hypothetical protein